MNGIEEHNGLSSGSEHMLDQEDNIPPVTSKGCLLSINAMQKGYSANKTMSRIGVIPNKHNLSVDVIHTVQHYSDMKYQCLDLCTYMFDNVYMFYNLYCPQ